MSNSFFLLPFLAFAWFIPIIIAIWFLLKIQSIDSTLRDISRKLDRFLMEKKE